MIALNNQNKNPKYLFSAYILAVLALFLFLATSCRTDKERSRRLLEKANRLYPIEFTTDTLLKIDTVLVVDTVIVIKSDTIKVFTIIENDEKGNLKPFKDRLLLNNDKAIVYGTLQQDGALSVSVTIKERKEKVTLKVPFKYRFITKRMYYKSPPEIIKVRGVFWWTGLIVIIGSVLYGLIWWFRYK